MQKSKRFESAVFYRRLAHEHPKIVAAEGVYLFDKDGKRYLDGSSGALVANIGHGVQSVAQAMATQAALAGYVHGTMFTTENIETYACELAKICPLPDPKFYFLTSGSEVVEAAIKFARQVQIARGHPGRFQVISRQQSYHGASLGALAVTGKPKMRAPFEPLFVDMPKIPPPYCYRCPDGLVHPQCELRCAARLEDEILHQGEENVAAFIAEPISGATLGAVVPPPEYWPKIREICDRYGLLLIADEVMSGMGRSGAWFAIQHWGVQADIITIGKGSAGGYFPLAAMAVQGRLVDQIIDQGGDFIHGGTYSHHAVGCATGLAVLEYLQENQLLEKVPQKGAYLQNQLQQKLTPLGWVGDIRGLGLMWGIELVADRQTKDPFDPEYHINQNIADEASRRGLIIYPGSGCVDGKKGDLLMLGPPFTITEKQINEMVELLYQSLVSVLGPA
jgi:adenosylmethionine-8-amino-7-oxononanoate aminotransferase